MPTESLKSFFFKKTDISPQIFSLKFSKCKDSSFPALCSGHWSIIRQRLSLRRNLTVAEKNYVKYFPCQPGQLLEWDVIVCMFALKNHSPHHTDSSSKIVLQKRQCTLKRNINRVSITLCTAMKTSTKYPSNLAVRRQQTLRLNLLEKEGKDWRRETS